MKREISGGEKLTSRMNDLVRIRNIVSAFNSKFSVESNIDLFDQIKKKMLNSREIENSDFFFNLILFSLHPSNMKGVKQQAIII